MTRNTARTAWKASGLTVNDLTRVDLAWLATAVEDEISKSSDQSGRLRCADSWKITRGNDHRILFAELTCASDYFEGRQAISFEDNGFVGFAGWADDGNAALFTRAFTTWLDALQTNRAARRKTA